MLKIFLQTVHDVPKNMTVEFLIYQNSYGNTTRLKIFYTSKKISLPIQRQAKQELKIKVAQNLLEGTLYQSASHHKFFFFGIETLMGVERFEVIYRANFASNSCRRPSECY